MSQEVILFADNDPRFLRVRKEFLEEEGYQVFPAGGPTEARRVLEQKAVDLTILDIRLVDDEDEEDISGLELAREIDCAIPKIILTGFPTWQAVREALGPNLDELPLAVDFISKPEGSKALLRAVDWAIHRPQLRANILDTFEIHALMALPERLAALGPEEASSRLQTSFEMTSEQLTRYREQENKRASQYHFWGLMITILAITLILVSVLLILIGQVDSTTPALISSALSQAISFLLFKREDAAHKRVSSYFTRLNELNNLGNLITICDSLGSSENRETYKKKVINKVIDKWFSA